MIPLEHGVAGELFRNPDHWKDEPAGPRSKEAQKHFWRQRKKKKKGEGDGEREGEEGEEEEEETEAILFC